MSENILAEIYNKILGLFGQSVSKEESKNTAVNRLRLVLMQDRTNLTPEIMHRMRSELIEVLSKYVELDKEALELNFEQEGEQMALMLSIPVIRAKDEEEIAKAIAESENNDEDIQEDETEEDEKIDEETEISEDEEISNSDQESSTEVENLEIVEENKISEATEDVNS